MNASGGRNNFKKAASKSKCEAKVLQVEVGNFAVHSRPLLKRMHPILIFIFAESWVTDRVSHE